MALATYRLDSEDIFIPSLEWRQQGTHPVVRLHVPIDIVRLFALRPSDQLEIAVLSKISQTPS